jgi:hypothetical protein
LRNEGLRHDLPASVTHRAGLVRGFASSSHRAARSALLSHAVAGVVTLPIVPLIGRSCTGPSWGADEE